MGWHVTTEELLAVPADAAVLPVEINMAPGGASVCAALVEAGGDALRRTIRQCAYLPVGKACAVRCERLPFGVLILAAAPRWLTGKANEMLLLRSCWQEVYDTLETEGCRSVVSPYLSVMYYRFPRHQAVHIARTESERHDGIETTFVAGDDELLRLSTLPYRKPHITAYVGYYHDDAVFALDNGQYARIDLRPERRRFDVVPYVEACYRVGTDPAQTPLPPDEIERLRRTYEEGDI